MLWSSNSDLNAFDAFGNTTIPMEVDTFRQDARLQAVTSHASPLRYTSDMKHSTTSVSEDIVHDLEDIGVLSNPNSSLHTLVKRVFFENGPNIVGFSGNLVNIRRYGRVEMAVLDAALLALMGFYGVDANPGSFNRYFNEQDKCTVRAVFSRLIGDGRPVAIDFQRYRIYNNFSGDVNDPNKCSVNKPGLMAYAVNKILPTPQDPQAERRFMVLCEAAWTRWGETGRPLAEITCDSLLPDASQGMECLSYSILHEWLHWFDMFWPISGPIEDFNAGGPATVVPPNGYGPYNAHWLKMSGQSTTQNDDSYVWLALETYFQWKCPGKIFSDPQLADNPLSGIPWEQ